MTDTQLKQALAKMLPEKLSTLESSFEDKPTVWTLHWDLPHTSEEVKDTELLHLCWLVEETLDEKQQRDYQIHLYCEYDNNWTYNELVDMCFELSWDFSYWVTHATWQQRVKALAKVKGGEIV